MNSACSKIKMIYMILLLSVSPFLAQTAFAVPFGFFNITNNNSTDATIGVAQLSVDVTSFNSGVKFHFTNSGPLASSITDVYFDDVVPSLLGNLFGIASSSGVSFSPGASPPNLPGGNDPLYSFVADLSADSNRPVQPNGINPGEYLDIIFTGANIDNVLAAIYTSGLRIGIHVQGFNTGGSEGFINTAAPVPEPTSMLLFGTGLLTFAGYFRKQFKKN